MYSRGFGMETDGGFREVEPAVDTTEASPACAEAKERKTKKGVFGKLDTEDLLLIGIALLLLADGDGDNDMLALLVLALILF